MAKKLVFDRQFSIRLACACVNISESGYRYVPLLSSENVLIADWLLRLTEANKQWGFGLCFLYLRNVKGFGWNHKRVYRIYRELELNLRIKPRKRIKRDKPDVLSVPLAKNQVWSMDFMSDTLADGRSITLLYIQPGKPTQNAYVERFNRTVRHEWLNMHMFESVAQAQELATKWLWLYNNERPNTAVGGIPPIAVLKAA